MGWQSSYSHAFPNYVVSRKRKVSTFYMPPTPHHLLAQISVALSHFIEINYSVSISFIISPASKTFASDC